SRTPARRRAGPGEGRGARDLYLRRRILRLSQASGRNLPAQQFVVAALSGAGLQSGTPRSPTVAAMSHVNGYAELARCVGRMAATAYAWVTASAGALAGRP